MKLKIGARRFRLDQELASDVVAIVGRRGRGKTTTAVVMVEELHRAGARFCVADPVGVWHGLKSSKDGKKAGLPVVVVGGDHADVPLEETAGRVVAELVANPSNPSVVLDFLHFRKKQMTRFMADFLEELYHKNRSALHLVLDEADKFAPQRVMGDTARLVGATEDIVKMGRARGILPILITQRPAALNKNVLTQAGLFISHALTGPQDRRAVDEWIRENANEDEREQFHGSIAGLPRGVAWFWQPEARIFEKVQVRARKTFDSSATPSAKRSRRAPKVVAKVDLEAWKERVADTIQRAKENDPKELKRRITELERKLKQKPESTTQIEHVEVPVLNKGELSRLEASVSAVGKFSDELRGELKAVSSTIAEISAALAKVRRNGHRTGGRMARQRHEPARPSSASTVSSELSPAKQRILNALAFLEGIGIQRANKVQLALLADASPKSSAYTNNLGALRSAGAIDYPGQGFVELTAAGRELANPEMVPTTVDELHDVVRSKLPAAKWRIVEALIQHYPESLPKEQLAELAGASSTSSAFTNNLGSLRSLGLIDYPERGEVVAQPVLFLEASS